jgi:hypothetical protein
VIDIQELFFKSGTKIIPFFLATSTILSISGGVEGALKLFSSVIGTPNCQ